MKLNRKALKRNTIDTIHGGGGKIIWIGLAFILITLLLEYLTMAVNGEISMLKQLWEKTLAGEAVSYAELLESQSEGSGFAGVLVTAMEVISVILSAGFMLACLHTVRREKADVGNLFDGFGFFLRTLIVALLRYFMMMLYSMLYVLPVSLLMVPLAGVGEGAIVAAVIICLPLLIPSVKLAYGYRQAVYLLLDDPRRSPMDCLRGSKLMMQGHKMELFKLDLSFIGWYLLSIIPLASVWVLPYRECCCAAYFDMLMADFKASHPMPAAPGDNTPDNSENNNNE